MYIVKKVVQILVGVGPFLLGMATNVKTYGFEQPNSYPQPQQYGYPPQQQPYQPPYYAPPPQYAQANPIGPTVVFTPQPHATCVVTHQGNCPTCHIGNLIPSYNPCGVVLAILFFPIGILCCLAMVDQRCTHCGYCA